VGLPIKLEDDTHDQFLADHPEAVSAAADWIFDEWARTSAEGLRVLTTPMR
jgi:hypothetical protein